MFEYLVLPGFQVISSITELCIETDRRYIYIYVYFNVQTMWQTLSSCPRKSKRITQCIYIASQTFNLPLTEIFPVIKTFFKL